MWRYKDSVPGNADRPDVSDLFPIQIRQKHGVFHGLRSEIRVTAQGLSVHGGLLTDQAGNDRCQALHENGAPFSAPFDGRKPEGSVEPGNLVFCDRKDFHDPALARLRKEGGLAALMKVELHDSEVFIIDGHRPSQLLKD